MTGRARGWTITLNNYSEEEWKNINEFAQLHTEKYIFGKEVGESGTPHIQGYVYFKNPKDMKGVKKILNNNKLHLEVAKGNTKQNLSYCSKDGKYESKGMEDPIEWKPENGKEYEIYTKSMLDEIFLMLRKMDSERSICYSRKIEYEKENAKIEKRKIEEGYYDYDEE